METGETQPHLVASLRSAISLIQTSRENHNVATDASDLRGIGGIYKGQIFAQRVPSRHQSKHIDYKEMFAILHAFMLWHENWKNGRVRLACDNSAVVDAMANHSISGPAIRPLQTILLIASLFDIEIMVFWIPSKENIVADAASQFNFKKLADLGFQDQIHTLCHPPSSSAMSNLLQKLNFSYIKPSPQQLGEIMSQSNNHTKPAADIIATCPTPLLP